MQRGRRLPVPRIFVFSLLLAWAATAVWAKPLPAPTEPSAPVPVILISVDTLRADHLSGYGYKKLTTPHIDSLARGGTVFTEISSQAPITLPSHVSLFTSTYPFANGIRENAQVLPQGAVTLATVLAAHEYQTAAFIGGYFLERRFGLAQGFKTYDSPFDTRVVNGALDLKRPAAQVLNSAEHWLEQNSGHSFFLFVHLFDLHQPYDAPAGYRARSSLSEYDQELAYVDDSLGSFFEFLEKSGLDRRALVVLFSDHGESLGDHGENTHGYFIYRSTLHVPLIFHWPQGMETGNSKLETRNSTQQYDAPASFGSSSSETQTPAQPGRPSSQAVFPSCKSRWLWIPSARVSRSLHNFICKPSFSAVMLLVATSPAHFIQPISAYHSYPWADRVFVGT